MTRRAFLAILSAPVVVTPQNRSNEPWFLIFEHPQRKQLETLGYEDMTLYRFKNMHPRDQVATLMVLKRVYKNPVTERLLFEYAI